MCLELVEKLTSSTFFVKIYVKGRYAARIGAFNVMLYFLEVGTSAKNRM